MRFYLTATIIFFCACSLSAQNSLPATGNVGIGTSTPPQSLTIASTSNGFSYYNTADQGGNYERVRQYWNGNVYNIASESVGSGTNRDIQLVTANGLRLVTLYGSPILSGTFRVNAGSDVGNTSAFGVVGNFSSAAGTQYGISDLRAINQSGSAGYRGLWISPYEQSTGSGDKFLIDAGTNTEPNGNGTHTGKFRVTNTGNGYFAGSLGIGTTSPTHSLTLASTSNGFTFYNTADQGGNYERVRQYWNGNAYNIASESAGSGTNRDIHLVVANGFRFASLFASPLLSGTLRVSASSNMGSTSAFGIVGSFTSTSGTQYGISDLRAINQSGSAGYCGLWISPYEQSLGSGTKYLIDAGTNTEANGTGIHTGKFSITNTGNGYFAGNVGIGILNPLAALHVNGGVLIGTPTTGNAYNAAYKLDVKGNVRADKMVVNTTGADFVFDSSYTLRSLNEVEAFIKQNNHLPEIAPAAAMQQNGVDVGATQTQLLQKIEELTLYLIEQAKKMEKLEKEVKALKVK